MRDAVERLVAVATWDRHGQSFEFANFTDRQLARASAEVDPRKDFSEDRVAMARRIRARRGSIAPLIGGASKLVLAEALWPVLEARMRLAQKRGTQLRIPVVAVVDRAVTLAHELPRKNVVIPLRPAP